MAPRPILVFTTLAFLTGTVLLAQDPGREAPDPDRLYHEGLSLFQNRKFANAEQVFTKVLDLRQRHMPAMYLRGACRLALGKYAESVVDFDRVVAAMPDFAKAIAQRGRARMGLEEYAEAEVDLRTAMEKGGDDPGWRLDLEQARMLGRGAEQYGRGKPFPNVSFQTAAPVGQTTSQDIPEGKALDLLGAVDRAARALSGGKPFRGIVIYFFPTMRSPSDRARLSEMSEFKPELHARGLTLAAVSSDPPEKLFELLEGKDLKFPVYADPMGRAAWKLGLLNIRRKELGESLPTMFVIDAGGIIRMRRTVLNPSQNLPFEKVLKEIDETLKRDDLPGDKK